MYEKLVFGGYTILVCGLSSLVTYTLGIEGCSKEYQKDVQMTCSMIGSCEGAQYRLKQGHTELDRDKDGKACEDLC